MPKSIFDLVTAADITAYWETMAQQRAPYVGEQLFPAQKQLGLNLEWINGNSGIPIVLNLSAFDANVIPRTREGFTVSKAQMPFFKESFYIDEELRQQLNMVADSGKPALIDVVMNRIFNDATKLLEAARAQRERMRMSALTTGALTLASNGQKVTYDYGIPVSHKSTVSHTWGASSATPIEDIRSYQDTIESDTGVRPTRAICNSTVWNQLLNDSSIRNSIFVYTPGVSAAVTDAALRNFLREQLDLEVYVNNKFYKNEAGVKTKFVADATFAIFPEGQLGNTWFGTTPEESDLLSSSVANVSIADLGVAVTTMKKSDPVNVETKVSMITLPSLESADQIYLVDTTA